LNENRRRADNLAGAIHKTLAVAAPARISRIEIALRGAAIEKKRSSSPGFGKWFAVLR